MSTIFVHRRKLVEAAPALPSWLWWKLDETTGTTVADSSGNARSGDITGSPARVAGIAPGSTGAFEFAAGQYILAGTTFLPGATGFSAEAYIKPTTIAGNSREIVQADAGGGNRIFQFRIEADGKLNLIHFSSGGAVLQTPSVSTLVTGTVYKVRAEVYVSGGSSRMRIYINDVLDNEATHASVLPTASDSVVEVGAHTTGNSQFLGVIDEVKVWADAPA